MSNELDRQIGEKLGNYESAVDTDALWRAVQPPRRRRPWGWLILLLLIAVGTAFWLSPETITSTEMIASTEATSDITTTGEKIVPIGVDLAGNQVESVEVIAPQATPESAREANRLKRGSTTATTQNEDEKASTSPGMQNVGSASSGTPFAETSTRQGENSWPIKEAKVDQPINEKSTTSNNTSSLLLEEAKEQEVEPLTSLSQASVQEEARPTVAESELLTTNPITVSTQHVATLTFSAHYLYDLPIALVAASAPSVVAPPRSKKQEWFVQADAAFLFPQRDLGVGMMTDSTMTNSTWVNDRTSQEKVLEGLNADFSIGFRAKNNWQLRAGLGYTQVNILYRNNFTTQTVDTVNGLKMLVYGPDNSVDSIIGPVAFYETTLREKQTYNSFRQWEVPVLAGYNIDLGALELLIEGGVRVQLNRSWEGEISYGEEGLQDWATKEWYRSGLALSLQGGVQLAYPLSEKLDVLAGGSVRYSLQDFSLETSPFEERYQLLGGQVSLRYKF